MLFGEPNVGNVRLVLIILRPRLHRYYRIVEGFIVFILDLRHRPDGGFFENANLFHSELTAVRFQPLT
jgi:hypothetical protein